MTHCQRYRLQLKATSSMLREYFSGVLIESLRRGYGYSEKKIRELFGYTRQGYWKQRQEHYREEIDTTALLNEVRAVRADMPRCGVRKLKVILEEHGHRIGRDRLFGMLRSEGMLVVRRHARTVTTYSRHWMKKHGNPITNIAKMLYFRDINVNRYQD